MYIKYFIRMFNIFKIDEQISLVFLFTYSYQIIKTLQKNLLRRPIRKLFQA